MLFDITMILFFNIFFFQKLHLDIQMGEHIIDHHNEKTKDSMQTLEEVLYHLIDQAIFITRHQEYQRVNISLFLMSLNRTNRGTSGNKLHILEALPTQLTFAQLCPTFLFFFFLGERGEISTGQ